MVADACQHIKNLAVFLCCIPNAVGGNHRQVERGREAQQRLVTAFFFALMVALQLDIQIAVAIDGRESIGKLACSWASIARKGGSQRSFVAPGEADQTGGELLQIIQCRRALSLGCFAHLEARDQLAELLVAGLRGTEQQQARRLGRELVRKPGRWRKLIAESTDRDLRAYMRLHAALLCHGVKARHTVEPITIGQCNRWHAELLRPLGQRFRLRATIKKAEGACGVQLDVCLVVSHRRPRAATRCGHLCVAHDCGPEGMPQASRRWSRPARPTLPYSSLLWTTSNRLSSMGHMRQPP